MEEQSSSEQVKAANKWADRLRSRGRMAMAAMGGLLALGVMGVANPLLDRIAESEARLKKAEARATLGSDVLSLRRQAELYQKKLPHTVDQNDWTEYLLTGIRAEPVKLLRMDPKEQVAMGPCKVLGWQIDLEGDYQSLGRVLAWMENGPRLVRVDHMAMQMPSGKLAMQIVVRGLALDKPEAAKPETVSIETVKGATTRQASTRPAAKPPATKAGQTK